MQVLRNYFPCSNARARYVSDYHVVYHKADDLTIHLMVIVDVTELPKDFTQMCDEMEKLGDEIGVSIRCQREDIFEKMHRL